MSHDHSTPCIILVVVHRVRSILYIPIWGVLGGYLDIYKLYTDFSSSPRLCLVSGNLGCRDLDAHAQTCIVTVYLNELASFESDKDPRAFCLDFVHHSLRLKPQAPTAQIFTPSRFLMTTIAFFDLTTISFFFSTTILRFLHYYHVFFRSDSINSLRVMHFLFPPASSR